MKQNHQFCWCLHCEWFNCGKVLSNHFCYEKQWQDICIVKASEFIRLWFLAYLWSFPRAYCLCVHVQLECSYPVSQIAYGRVLLFSNWGCPSVHHTPGPPLPSWAPQTTGPCVESCTSPGPDQRYKEALKSTLRQFKTSSVCHPTALSPSVCLNALSSVYSNLHRFKDTGSREEK